MIEFKHSFSLLTLLSICTVGCGTAKHNPITSTPTGAPTQVEATKTAPPELALGDTRRGMIDDMLMVYVPAGEFPMGSDEEEVDYALEQCKAYGTNCRSSYFSVELPQHTVVLDGFWLYQTEVTQSRYDKCAAAGTCSEIGCQSEIVTGNGDHPVVCVTWHQAAAYCEWAGGRLPTEAEWEYAARGADESRYPWGDEFVGTNLNYCDANCALDKRDEMFDDGYSATAPVGSYPAGASWVGALDMAGNVWEMVADWNSAYTSENQTNPTGPESGGRRVARGGSWHASPDHVRSTLRTHMGPADFVNHAGFRCVQSAK